MRPEGAPSRISAAQGRAHVPSKHVLKFRALMGCATVALFEAALAATPPLTLAEAQRLAIERSPRVAAYAAAISAARDMAVAATQLAEIKAVRRNVETIAGSTALQQPLRPETRAALAERYAHEADLVAAQRVATSVDIGRETAWAWLECHYVEQMTRVAAEQLKFAQAELEGAEHLYWAGRLTQAEFYATRSMLVLFEDKWKEFEHRGRAARIALKRWVGDGGDAPLASLPSMDRLVLKPAALEGDLLRHPQVALLDKQEQLAASDVRVAQAERQAPPEVAVMLAKREEARSARDEKLRAEVADMRMMIDEWQHARDRLDRYARQLVSLARERTLATLAAYRGGKATLMELLAARRAETETQMQSVETEREAARLWARINFALPARSPTAPPQASGAGAPR
jgi:outer membrane protein TolC